MLRNEKIVKGAKPMRNEQGAMSNGKREEGREQ
jgi:hypothetical protein